MFNVKAKLWIEGRSNLFYDLSQKLKKNQRTIWFHCASLGEFEQGLPVIKALQNQFPEKQILVTFFSPSGFQIAKKQQHTFVISYLPIDVLPQMKRFVYLVNPEKVFFVKYEFWYNLMFALHQKSIPFYYISAIFRENQVFFKSFGKWFAQHLHFAKHFFVQDDNSEKLLHKLHISNVTISGDTRFNRVKEIVQQNNFVDYIDIFKNQQKLIVFGSTWKEDNDLIIEYLHKNNPENLKIVIVPHQIKTSEIQKLQEQILPFSSVKYSEIIKQKVNENQLKNTNVLIIDSVGLLSKLYSYVDIAYVGGGFGKEGVHNVLEPAVFGVPILIAPIFNKFIEAESLVKKGGILVIQNAEELSNAISFLSDDKNAFIQGKINKDFIDSYPDAVATILAKIQ